MRKAGILQIAYYFPPIKTVGTLRNARFAQIAPRYWEKVYVLSTRHTQVFDGEGATHTESNLIRVPSFDFRWLIWWLRGRKATYFSPQLKSRTGITWLRKALDGFPFNILLNDGGLMYILLGYWRAVGLIKKEGITHLYSSFRPMSDHCLAYLLVLRFPHLQWMADFRDLPVDPFLRNVFWPGFQLRMLRKMLNAAALVTTVSEGLAANLQQCSQSKVKVLYNAPLADPTRTQESIPFHAFSIVYTGSLYPGQQSAAPLLATIRMLIQSGFFQEQQIRLVVCGKDGGLWQEWVNAFGLHNILDDRGMLEHEEALKLQAAAQLNLLLTWNSPQLGGILTSKVFEYLQAKRPVLALVNGDSEKELEHLLDEYTPGSLVFYAFDQIEKLQDFFKNAFQSGQGGNSGKQHFREPPTWEHEMEKLFGPDR